MRKRRIIRNPAAWLAVAVMFAGFPAVILAGSPAVAAERAIPSGRAAVGETWVWPSVFQQALAPLAPLATKAVRDGLCPGLTVGANGFIHRYMFEAKFRKKGVENERWTVSDLRLTNPSACPALDEQVSARMRDAIPEFAWPRQDIDGNGWIRIPAIEIHATN